MDSKNNIPLYHSYCLFDNCKLDKINDYSEVEIHFLFHFKKCLECGFRINGIYDNNQNIESLKQTLKLILEHHKTSIRHSEFMGINSYYKKRFNLICNFNENYYKLKNKEKENDKSGYINIDVEETLNDFIDECSYKRIKLDQLPQQQLQLQYHQNQIQEEEKPQPQQEQPQEEESQLQLQSQSQEKPVKQKRKYTRKKQLQQTQPQIHEKQLITNKVDINNNLNKYDINDKDILNYVSISLSNKNISFEDISKLFKDKKLIEILNQNQNNLKDLERKFNNLHLNLKTYIYESDCIDRDSCKHCTSKENEENKHEYWSFDIIDLFKSILLSDAIDYISFYPISLETYNLYSSSNHFYGIFDENQDVLNIVFNVNVDIELIEGIEFNVVYISIANTVSTVQNQRYYLGVFPLCINVIEALFNLLKPILSNRKSISLPIKIPTMDKNSQSNPLPIEAINKAIKNKNHYSINKNFKESQKEKAKLDNENFDKLIKILTEQRDYQEEETNLENSIECYQPFKVKYYDTQNKKEDFNNKIKINQHSAYNNIKLDSYNNYGVSIANNGSNDSLIEDSNPNYSSFFEVLFNILDISGNNPQISKLFLTIKDKDGCCRFCYHPKNLFSDYEKTYGLRFVEPDLISLYFERINQMNFDQNSIITSTKKLKELLEINFSSVPLFFFNFKLLYNPINCIYNEEIKILFFELKYLLEIVEKSSKSFKHKKIDELNEIIIRSNYFEILYFIEDINGTIEILFILMEQDILNYDQVKCFLLHLKYFFKLRKESFTVQDLEQLNIDIIDHHKLFSSLYGKSLNGDILESLHFSKHWDLMISFYGSPIFQSIISYKNKELVNGKSLKSICKIPNEYDFKDYVDNLSKQLSLVNEKKLSNIIKPFKFGKSIQDVQNQTLSYSSIKINGKKYRVKDYCCIYGSKTNVWFCQIQSINEDSIYIKYFEPVYSIKNTSNLVNEVFKKKYLLDTKVNRISLIDQYESLLEKVNPIIVNEFYYFPSCNEKEIEDYKHFDI